MIDGFVQVVCARRACKASLVGQPSFMHKHTHWRYCVSCARKINEVCPEDPPFDWLEVLR